MLVNAMEVEGDFTWLGRKFEKGAILEFPNKHLITVSWTTAEGTMMQAITLGAYADVMRSDFYDIVRFVFECNKHLSIIKFRK